MSVPTIGKCPMCTKPTVRLLLDGFCLFHFGEAIVRSNHEQEEVIKQPWSGINKDNPGMVTSTILESMHHSFMELPLALRYSPKRSNGFLPKAPKKKRR